VPGNASKSTVVIITRNRRPELLHTLRHMTTLPDAAPIIVLDNASTDGTSEAVAAEFPEVTLLRGKRNLGATGRNVAVDRVTTPYVAFCDDDTRWQPGSLSRAAELLDRHPGLAAVVARCLLAPRLAEDPVTPEMRDSPVPGPSWLPGPALLSVLAATTMFRTDAFRGAGGFSPRVWFGGEEELLTLDLVSQGWWVCWAEELVVHHEPSVFRDPLRRRQLVLRNALWTTWLRRPLRSALRRSASVLASAPKDRHTASAVVEALAGLPWIVRDRKVVPPHVERNLRLLENPPAQRQVG
jgi:GT2 family glycosyltransferase